MTIAQKMLDERRLGFREGYAEGIKEVIAILKGSLEPADLLQHGLLRASFIPDKAHRELRELVGYRKSLIKEQSAELNRMQKMLEGANIKLSGTISNINGISEQKLLKAILSGEKIDLAFCI